MKKLYSKLDVAVLDLRAHRVRVDAAHRDLPYPMIVANASLIVDTRNALALFGHAAGERHIVRL